MAASAVDSEAAICVLNVPANATEDELKLHFMSQENGGKGDVKFVRCREYAQHGSGSNEFKMAHVGFKKMKNRDRVLEAAPKSKPLKGQALMLLPDADLFEKASVVISYQLVACLGELLGTAWERKMLPAGVTVDPPSEGRSRCPLTVTGSFEQISSFRANIEQVLASRRRSSATHVPDRPNEHIPAKAAQRSDESDQLEKERSLQLDAMSGKEQRQRQEKGGKGAVQVRIDEAEKDAYSAHGGFDWKAETKGRRPSILSGALFKLTTANGVQIGVVLGDITKQSVDAIVNAANPELKHMGGVARAIVNAAGPSVQEESDAIIRQQRRGKKLAIGEAVKTKAGNLPSVNLIIHVVGPRYNEDCKRDPAKASAFLQTAYTNVFQECYLNFVQSVAVPAISCGVYGVPTDISANAAVQALSVHLASGKTHPKVVAFIDMSVSTAQIFLNALSSSFPDACTSDGKRAPQKDVLPVNGAAKASLANTAVAVVTNFASSAAAAVANFTSGATVKTGARTASFSEGITSEHHTPDERMTSTLPAQFPPRKELYPISQLRDQATNVADRKNRQSADVAEEAHEACPICKEDLNTAEATTLPACKHTFHITCIAQSFEKCQRRCPVCKQAYGEQRGNQPSRGKMTVHKAVGNIAGTACTEYYRIEYAFPSGVQNESHPDPGNAYTGITRSAFLPVTPHGDIVLALLRVAFDRGLTFTIGRSSTTGNDGVITWNDIHHKTSLVGTYGYPDSDYLDRVEKELAAFGIKRSQLPDSGTGQLCEPC